MGNISSPDEPPLTVSNVPFTALRKSLHSTVRGLTNHTVIFFRYFQIPALKVEASLMSLPYIADACVLGVPYHEARQLCGAVVRLQSNATQREVNLASIRAELAGDMPAYMLPAVLRILKEGEQLPRTHSGKPVKKQILSELLGTTDSFPAEDLPDGVEYFGSMPVIDAKTAKPWDWAGMQRAR